MIGVSKTFGGSSILSSPAKKKASKIHDNVCLELFSYIQYSIIKNSTITCKIIVGNCETKNAVEVDNF